jgi:hypothetical protein
MFDFLYFFICQIFIALTILVRDSSVGRQESRTMTNDKNRRLQVSHNADDFFSLRKCMFKCIRKGLSTV